MCKAMIYVQFEFGLSLIIQFNNAVRLETRRR